MQNVQNLFYIQRDLNPLLTGHVTFSYWFSLNGKERGNTQTCGRCKSPKTGLLMHALDTFYNLCLWLHELGITLLWIAHLVRALTLPLYRVKWVNWWIQKLLLFPCNCLITYLNLCWHENTFTKSACWDRSFG